MLRPKDLVRLDSAVCSHTYRSELMKIMETVPVDETKMYSSEKCADLVRWLYIRHYKAKVLDFSKPANITCCMDIAPDVWSILNTRSEILIDFDVRVGQDRDEYCSGVVERFFDSLPHIGTLHLTFSTYDRRIADTLVAFVRASNRSVKLSTGSMQNTVSFLRDTRLAPFVHEIHLYNSVADEQDVHIENDLPPFNNVLAFVYEHIETLSWYSNASPSWLPDLFLRCPNATSG